MVLTYDLIGKVGREVMTEEQKRLLQPEEHAVRRMEEAQKALSDAKEVILLKINLDAQKEQVKRDLEGRVFTSDGEGAEGAGMAAAAKDCLAPPNHAPAQVFIAAREFTIYDMIVVHAGQYDGLACSQWLSDLTLLEDIVHHVCRSDCNLFVPIDDACLKQIYWENVPMLRDHLLRWGFIKAKPEEKVERVFKRGMHFWDPESGKRYVLAANVGSSSWVHMVNVDTGVFLDPRGIYSRTGNQITEKEIIRQKRSHWLRLEEMNWLAPDPAPNVRVSSDDVLT